MNADPTFWRGRRVLVTGHTGFKGGWLALWLHELGAQVVGLSNGIPTVPSFYEAVDLRSIIPGHHGDIADADGVHRVIEDTAPEFVFHLAAQSLVRRSYAAPAETYRTNVIGTLSVLEAIRSSRSVRVAVLVTSDKCYEERAPNVAHTEIDPLGGDDPYSSSKACAEIVTRAYQASFLRDRVSTATVRAGNVIGGGDWGHDRLVPDIARAAAARETVQIRHPSFIRPWQHVLDCLRGYIVLAERLSDDDSFVGPWNFGPHDTMTTVEMLVRQMARRWPGGIRWEITPDSGPKEAVSLRLDPAKADQRLGWRTRWDLPTAVGHTVDWYAAHARGDEMLRVSREQIGRYERDA